MHCWNWIRTSGSFSFRGFRYSRTLGKHHLYRYLDKIFLFGNRDTLSIPLTIYQRSNKNTCMHQKPQVQRGKYIKKGQILADGAATAWRRTRFGKKRISSLYAMGEGYNSEDAVLISERLIYEDIYTSFHIRKYEIQTHMTSYGSKRIINQIPHLEAHFVIHFQQMAFSHNALLVAYQVQHI
ncbi:hypothetical protein Fmac_001833 [Flemingia macrophylla]|uniref:DNA-directed RNA polymerase n=1 Tax=Flemingia macrophylla TaxID=520843 RepID=A0ABD1NI71_9FABA